MHRPKRTMAAACAAAMAILAASGCGRNTPTGAQKPSPPPAAGAASAHGPGARTPATRTYDIRDSSGRPAKLAVSGPGQAAPTPGFAPVYPGATVQQAVTGAGGSGSGGLVTFRTAAGVEQVIGFYRQRAAAAGLANVVATQTGAGQSITAGKQGSEQGLQVTATPDKGETYVVLTWTEAARG